MCWLLLATSALYATLAAGFILCSQGVSPSQNMRSLACPPPGGLSLTETMGRTSTPGYVDFLSVQQTMQYSRQSHYAALLPCGAQAISCLSCADGGSKYILRVPGLGLPGQRLGMLSLLAHFTRCLGCLQHWEEKNRLDWSRQRLGELLEGLAADIDCSIGEARVTQLKSLSGEVRPMCMVLGRRSSLAKQSLLWQLWQQEHSVMGR